LILPIVAGIITDAIVNALLIAHPSRRLDAAGVVMMVAEPAPYTGSVSPWSGFG
jgi:hypothetical protein